jgi:phosphatidylinositol alpha-1,6-mannosyltransferase
LTPGVGEEHLSEEFVAAPCAGSDSVRRILSVARLVRRKGHLQVLEALPEVLRRIPDLKYTIIGSGPLEEELRAAAGRLCVQDHVVFRGNLDSGELLAEYAGSDCFILPNIDDPQTGDTEGFGIVFIEASAHGLPVIGGRTGGTEGAILEGQTGVRVDGRDRAALVSALTGILSEGDLARRYGEAGRRFVLTQMRWPGRAGVLRALLEDMADGTDSHD